jgi:2-phosphosulfolactate phosphatase
MEIRKVPLNNCFNAHGTVVVIDVCRAFTTAAYAFASGACEIILVGGIDDAFNQKEKYPHSIIIGEDKGMKVDGFDHGNSPAMISEIDLSGICLIQRTSAGTQGVVGSTQADRLYTASFVVASATAMKIRMDKPDLVTFVITGQGPGRDGEEDIAAADYISALIFGEKPDVVPFIQRVSESTAGRWFNRPEASEYERADLVCCLQIDKFKFAMPVIRRNSLFIMRALLINE